MGLPDVNIVPGLNPRSPDVRNSRENASNHYGIEVAGQDAMRHLAGSNVESTRHMMRQEEAVLRQKQHAQNYLMNTQPGYQA
jgi:hypothetical protein